MLVLRVLHLAVWAAVVGGDMGSWRCSWSRCCARSCPDVHLGANGAHPGWLSVRPGQLWAHLEQLNVHPRAAECATREVQSTAGAARADASLALTSLGFLCYTHHLLQTDP